MSRIITGPRGPVIVSIVSDGAGSATYAQFGSKAVCTGMLRCAGAFLSSRPLEILAEEHVWDWIDDVREFIAAKAQRRGAKLRDFAATLVAVLASEDVTVVLHVGDGAAVVRRSGTENWEIPSWPFQGEYASTTAFMTDDPQPRLVFTRIDDRIDQFAVFSDGIERMVLDTAARAPHAPFFNRMISPLISSDCDGSDPPLAAALRSYLGSPAVCERTDDDKTLILGARG